MKALSPGPQLALTAALCTGALAGLHQLANPLIEAGEQRARTRALQAFARPGEQIVATNRGWQLHDGEGVSAMILPATAPDGYSGAIELLVGVGVDGRSRGVRVTVHRETPGLGDGIEPGHPWSRQFDQRPVAPGWALRRDGGDIDQLSGATISARAVVRAAAAAIDAWHRAPAWREATP